MLEDDFWPSSCLIVCGINWGKGSSEKVQGVYGEFKPSWFELLGLSSTDWLMSCYCRRLARASSQQDVPTFLYQFLHPNSKGLIQQALQPDPAHPACVDGRAACHAGDNMYTMGSVDLIPSANFTVFESNLSRLIMKTTSSLAANIGSAPSMIEKAMLPLIPYDGVRSLAWGGTFVDGQEVLHSVVQNWRGHECDFWDTMTPS